MFPLSVLPVWSCSLQKESCTFFFLQSTLKGQKYCNAWPKICIINPWLFIRGFTVLDWGGKMFKISLTFNKNKNLNENKQFICCFSWKKSDTLKQYLPISREIFIMSCFDKQRYYNHFFLRFDQTFIRYM